MFYPEGTFFLPYSPLSYRHMRAHAHTYLNYCFLNYTK